MLRDPQLIEKTGQPEGPWLLVVAVLIMSSIFGMILLCQMESIGQYSQDSSTSKKSSSIHNSK